MHSLNGHLIGQLQPVFESLPDPRSGKNIQFQYADIAMAAFSIFHMLSPSFLHYQRIMDARLARNNCCSLYRMQRIPSDNHIRTQLDGIEPAALNAAFEIAPRLLLQHPKVHRNFQIFDDRTLIAVDGTQFHSSYKVHCNQCSTRNHKTTGTEYHHNARGGSAGGAQAQADPATGSRVRHPPGRRQKTGLRNQSRQTPAATACQRL